MKENIDLELILGFDEGVDGGESVYITLYDQSIQQEIETGHGDSIPEALEDLAYWLDKTGKEANALDSAVSHVTDRLIKAAEEQDEGVWDVIQPEDLWDMYSFGQSDEEEDNENI